jgi:hypothetical protein
MKDQGNTPDQNEIKKLRHHREMYKDGCLAFDALKDAIERD